ncbi:MAG: hypothetical protein GY785_18515 [Gammaproteobacteria bacterium]|nr:hypothetical protein [Gammaproteobacteria bacterium]
MSFTLNQRKRKVLFASALIFLLQSIAPAFQGVMARSVDGYMDTICTMYGPKTIFVSLDDTQEQDKPECYECTVCIIQANLNGQPQPPVSLLEARFVEDSRQLSELLYADPGPLFFVRFLSRAPPA